MLKADLFLLSAFLLLHEMPQRSVSVSDVHIFGCTLSSAIATKLSQGHSLKEAIALAKDYVTKAIETAKDMHIGHGHGPLWHFV